MYPDSHKLIVMQMYEYLCDNLDFELDKKKLLWGSVAPDFLPKYKLIGHYLDQSVQFISLEIMKVIFLIKNMDECLKNNKIFQKKLSEKIGIISHFIADYVCYPHAENIHCLNQTDARRHILYEKELNLYAPVHQFDLTIKNSWPVKACSGGFFTLQGDLVACIDHIVAEYRKKKISFAKDLNYAINLNIYLLDIIFEFAYSTSLEPQLNVL